MCIHFWIHKNPNLTKFTTVLIYKFFYADDTCVVVELKPEELTSGKVEDLYKDIMTYVKDTILHFVGLNGLPKYILVSAFRCYLSIVCSGEVDGFLETCFLLPLVTNELC